MKKGFRQQKTKTNKDRMRELETTVSNLQMAIRVMQMGLQQMGNSFQRIDSDIGNAMGVLNDIQYRTLAMIDSGNFDKDELDKAAEVIKLKDYIEASDKEDKEKDYTLADIVAEDSVVILTSICKEDSTKSIFRSKFKLDESGNPKAQEKLLGLKVGEKTELKIGELTHDIEIIGVRTAPAPEEEVDTATIAEIIPPEVTVQ